MDEQIFSDGVGTISIVGGTVRLDFVVYSPTEKDPKGQPLAVFRQRVVMGVEGFLLSATKIQEAVQALSKLGAAAHARNEPTAAAPAAAMPKLVEAPAPSPAPPQPAPETPPKRPFP